MAYHRHAMMIMIAATVIFHDAAGRVTGSAETDSNGVTEFKDPAGRVTGKARTDLNDVTHFYDPAGRDTGRASAGK
ncbi:MAG: hypothetical protein FWD08_05880 [Alphaproteobacteria bacterium]|nr:hypothetical protein [Alphaproteobacteria bacterium]